MKSTQPPSETSSSPATVPNRTRQLLQSLESLHQTQLIRVKASGALEAQRSTNPGVVADLAPHANGKRRPSLEELDRLGANWKRRYQPD